MTDIFTREQRKRLMSKVKSKDTNIELILRRLLWKKGLRYRVNYKIYGSPDIAFPRFRVAVFCDGDFWHGRNYDVERTKYSQFWQEKIAVNIRRDRKVNRQLRKEGWKVIRFWKTNILKTPDRCIEKIVKGLV